MTRFKEIWSNKDRRRGIIGTFLVHLCLLFALFFLALRTPLPLPGEEGVEVNFGYDEQGFGEIQSESAPPESQTTPPPPQEQVQQDEPEPEIIEPEPEITEPEPQPVEEEIITQDIEEAPVKEEKVIEEPEEEPEPIKEEPKEIKEEKKEPVKEPVKEPEEKAVDSTYVAENTEPAEEIVEDPKPVVNTKALYPGTSKNKSGTNQGNTQGAGDMGKPQGYKDRDKYDGRGGQGNGPSFSLGGRGGKYIDIPKVDIKDVGTVVVDIWVDREGNVIKAQKNYKMSNVFDPNQVSIAIESAKNSTFVADPNAPAEQRGTISYSFVILK